MTQRLRRILIMTVMAILTVTLMTASLLCSVTYARYAGGKFDEEKSIYDPIIEFVGANQYEVYSPEELVEAIENGYSYIKIGKGAEEPFVITTGVTDVTANLVIDLNGTTIVRNSRNPVLDVQRNVSAVLVFDSSVEEGGDVAQGAGSFYNPVGSALQVSGGTLTVAAGRYDSGPKDGIADNFTGLSSVDATVYSRTSRTTQDGYSISASASMPVLTEDVYIPQNVSSGYNFIKADTYLIYSREQNCYVDGEGTLIVNAVKDENTDGSTVITGDALAVPCNAASCDFYYYYPIDKDGNPIETGGTATAPQTYAVVYGYNDVKALAANDALDGTDLSKNGLVWPYAAVRSIRSTETVQEGEGRTTGGEGFMRGGAFSTYFGTENTYGIYAEGGTLSVADGVSFTAVGEGVCIRSQTSSTTTDSNAAASLEISGGTFSSELGDTIQMEGGSVTITGGTFKKNASSASSESTDNGSAIDIQGGSLKVNEKDTTAAATKSVIFNVTGDYVNGIKMDKGTETGTETQTADVIKNVTFDFNQSDGGTSVAAIQVAGGTLEVSGSIFNFNREASSNTAFSHNNGIYVRSSGEGDAAQSGTVTATNCTFNFGNNTNSSVTASAGIASVGGTVTATNCKFTLPGYSNYGIYATGGTTTVTGGSITMTGDSNHGVFASGGSTLVQGGSINMATQADPGNDNFGIEISDGTVTANGCAITVYGTYSAGVLAQGGTVNLGGTTGTTTITVTNSHQNNLLTSSAVSSETVTNGGTTTAGTINIEGVVTINSDSLGITARGKDGKQGKISVAGSGNITLWQGLNGDQTIVPMCTTGIYVSNGIVENEGTISLYSTIDPTYSWVPFPEETTLTSNINNGVYVQGGSLNSTGTLNVTFTGVVSDALRNGNNQYSDDGMKSGTEYRYFQVKSYAVRVEASGTTSSTVTIRKGEITNSCGGGVLAANGTVTLGTSGNENGNLTVLATAGEGIMPGTDRVHYDNCTIDGNSTDNWEYGPPKWGGDAIKTDGGTLTVDGGSYTAYYGNGILVTNGSATVNGGEFSGRDSRRINGGLYTGAGGNYGLKVLGGYATVNGGAFIDWVLDDNGNRVSGGGGGVFIMGTPTEEGETPKVTTIEKATIDVTGATGVALWEYANVVFGTEDSTNNSDLSVRAESTGMTVEYTRDNARQNITIYSGTFESYGTASNKNGIWYGEGGATLNIEGGVFKGSGSNGRGLLIANNPDGKITISGGTFVGGTGGSAISAGVTLSTSNIIASGSYCYYNNVDTPLRTSRNNNAAQVGGSTQGSVYLGNTVYYQLNGYWYSSDFNALGTIVVQ